MVPDFDTVFATLPDGWLSESEARLLWDTALGTSGPILEVGCHLGRSTCLLAALGCPLYCVDPWGDFALPNMSGDEVRGLWHKNVGARKFSPIPIAYAMKIEQWKPRRVGFAYLDGDHSYDGTRAQLLKALRCGPTAVAAHDVNDSGGGVEVKRALTELLGPWDRRAERLAVWRLREEYV